MKVRFIFVPVVPGDYIYKSPGTTFSGCSSCRKCLQHHVGEESPRRRAFTLRLFLVEENVSSTSGDPGED